jgi:hypothetical protein
VISLIEQTALLDRCALWPLQFSAVLLWMSGVSENFLFYFLPGMIILADQWT